MSLNLAELCSGFMHVNEFAGRKTDVYFSCGKGLSNAWRGREKVVGREDGTPFFSGGVVIGRAADQFVRTVEFFDWARRAKLGDSFGCVRPMIRSTSISCRDSGIGGGTNTVQLKNSIVSMGTRQVRSCTAHGGGEALSYQHGFGVLADADVGGFGRENLGKAAGYIVGAGVSGFAEPEKFLSLLRMMGRNFWR